MLRCVQVVVFVGAAVLAAVTLVGCSSGTAVTGGAQTYTALFQVTVPRDGAEATVRLLNDSQDNTVVGNPLLKGKMTCYVDSKDWTYVRSLTSDTTPSEVRAELSIKNTSVEVDEDGSGNWVPAVLELTSILSWMPSVVTEQWERVPVPPAVADDGTRTLADNWLSFGERSPSLDVFDWRAKPTNWVLDGDPTTGTEMVDLTFNLALNFRVYPN